MLFGKIVYIILNIDILINLVYFNRYSGLSAILNIGNHFKSCKLCAKIIRSGIDEFKVSAIIKFL